MDKYFDIQAVENSMIKYDLNKTIEGVVVLKRADGVIFNIGGKSDAFIPCSDFQDFSEIKVGDRFKVKITKLRNEEGLIECSKSLADIELHENLSAKQLKMGSVFTFYVKNAGKDGLYSQIGEYKIFVPVDETLKPFNLKKYTGKQINGIVTEFNKTDKEFIVSEKIIFEQEKNTAETNFWKSIFINKVVEGTVVAIKPYGAFIDVAGVQCLVHISDISYDRVDNIEDYLKVGETKQFRVIKLDRDNKKVSLGLKQLYDNPKVVLLKNVNVGEIYNGEVVKILRFGAIIKCENGLQGLLHISDATEDLTKNIYEIVKLDQKVKVEIKDIDTEREKVSFILVKN